VSRFRAALLVVAAVVELGCTNEVEDDPMALPPWHMWGSTEGIQVLSPGGGAPVVIATQQLARVSYKRPDTWRFLFFAQILSGQGVGGAPVAPGGNLPVNFDVTVGIGRGRVTIKNFVQFNFAWAGAFALNIGEQKWATKTVQPALDDQNNTPPILQPDEIIAQDIQVDTNARLLTVATGDVVQIQVGCMFAPNAHIRPEWNFKEPKFNGGEQDGQ
jgi:hypothetical protein